MLKSENVKIGRHGRQSTVTQMYHGRESEGKVSSRCEIFCNLKKIAILMLLDHILLVFRVIFLTFRKPIEKINCSILFLLTI